MKKIIYISVLLIFVTAKVEAQCCLNSLNASSKHVNAAYKLLKNFRDTINMYAEVGRKNHVAVYSKLYEDLKKAGAPIMLLNIDSSYFSRGERHAVMVINNNSNDSVRFIEIYKFVKKLSIDYEILLFEVKIEPLQNCCAAENEIYTQKYNEILASIGRRMGRLIQHAMNEDEDYVTNNSITRLDLAIAELRNHEYFLRNSITSQKVVAERKPVVDTIYVVTKIPELDLSRKNYISAVVDMQNFFGIGFYSTGTLDFGLDALYNFSSDFNLALQPKVGVGRGMYHFALGAYYLAEENYVEPMGNIYIISNNFLGGVGFNANRILFSIGYYFP